MKRSWTVRLALIICPLTAGAVFAQSPGTFGPGYNPGYAMNMDVAMSGSRGGGGSTICGRSYSDDNEKAYLLQLQAAGKCGGKQADRTSDRPIASRMSASPESAALTFRPSSSRTQTNLQAFVNKARSADPAGAAKMEQLFASTDVVGQIGAVMSRFGLSKNNAADAFALYWIAAWQAVHGDSSTPSVNMAKAVAAQASRGLSQSPEFRKATDAQKQEMAEALMVQAALIESSVEQAGSSSKQLNSVSRAVAKGAQATGLELNDMTLTEEGFVEGGPRKTGDATNAAGDETAGLAAAGKSDTATYALIAAAGGAGLGAMFLFGRAMGRKA